MEEILRAVSTAFLVSENDIRGKGKHRYAIMPRVAFSNIAHFCGHSYPRIGNFLGNRSHSTIIYHKKCFHDRYFEEKWTVAGDLLHKFAHHTNGRTQDDEGGQVETA